RPAPGAGRSATSLPGSSASRRPWDEGVPDAGMVFQPGPGAPAVVAGEVIGDHVDHALGVGLLLQLEEVLVEGAVAGRGAHGDRVAAGDAQPAVDPGLLRPAGVLQRRL